MSASHLNRRRLIPALIACLACVLLVLYAAGCRIIDPGYGNGYVPEGPTSTLFQSMIQPNQEYRIQGEGFELLIPAGAVPRSSQLSVFRTLRETNIFPVPASWTILSNTYTITSMGGIGSYNLSQLFRPAAMRIPFSTDLMPTGSDQSDVFIACYDGAQGLILRTPSVDMTNGMAMIETYHFSMWAVVARPPDLRPKAFAVAPRVETEPAIMAARTGNKFDSDLLFSVLFDLPGGAATVGGLSGWYMQFFPVPQTGLVLGHPTVNGNTRPLTAGYPFLEPIDLLKDPLITRLYDGTHGTLNFRLVFTDKTPAEAPVSLIWRLGARDPLGILYEREGQISFTVERRQITLNAPLGAVEAGTPISFAWTLQPDVRAYESVLLQIADHPEGFLLPRFETLLKPATTTYILDRDAAALLPADKRLHWRIVGYDLYKSQPISRPAQFSIGNVPEALSVVSTIPASGALNVSPAVTISAVFSRAIATGTIIPALSVTPAVIGDLQTTANSFSFTPDSALLENTRYLVGLASTITDLNGNGLEAPFEFSFTTGSLGAAGFANLLQFVPAFGAREVPPLQPIEMVFDRDMAAASVQAAFSLTPAAGGAAPVWSWLTPRHVRVTFPDGLAYGTRYVALLAASAASLGGQNMQQDFTWSFSTSASEDVTPPALLSVTPAAGARNVPLNTFLTLNFSEPMNTPSVENAVTVTSPEVGPLEFVWIPGGESVAVRPQAGWKPNSQHTVRVDVTAADVSGNRVEEHFETTFSTGSENGPIIVSSRPAHRELAAQPVSRLEFTFDRPMNRAKVQTAWSVIPRPVAAPTFLWSEGDTKLTISYPLPFPERTDVTAAFSASAQDVDGLPLAGQSYITFRTGDFTAPSLVSIAPASGSSQVAQNAKVTVRFSEAMQTSSPETRITLSPALSGVSYSWSADATQLFIERSSPWPAGSLQSFVLSGALKDAAGNPLGASVTFSLTFEASTAPDLVSFSPANGALNVSRTASIVLTFDRAMNRAVTEAACVIFPTSSVSASWNGASTVLTFTPTTAWANQTTYQVEISGSATDQNGIPIVGPRSFSFSTADTVPPALLTVSPVHQAFGVSRNTSLVFTFSEPVNTVNAQTAFSLTPAGPTAPIFSWSNANRTLSVTYGGLLNADTLYRTRFTTALTDASGNTPAAPFESEFTTESAVFPQVVEFAPPQGATGVARDTAIRFVFNKPMATPTVQVTITPDPGGTPTYLWSSDLKTLTYVPATSLNTGQLYSVQLSATSRDVYQNPLNDPRTVSFTVGTAVAATVAFAPIDGSTGVLTTTQPVLTFSKAMNTASVLAGLIISPAPGSINPTWTDGNKTLTLDLGALTASTTYTVSLAPTVLDADGVALGRTFSTTFTTRPPAPTILAFSPEDGATGVGLTSPVEIRFSQPMNQGSVNVTIAPDEPLGTRTLAWTADSQALTLSWSPGYEALKAYTVTVSGQDTYGQNLTGTLSSSFTSANVDGPTIVSFSPSTGTQNASRSVRLTAVFSRAMKTDDTQSAFSLSPVPTGVPIFSWSPDQKTLEITFSQPLDYDTYYTAAFGTTARDPNLVRLASAFSSWFVTEARPTILSANVSPSAGATEVASAAVIRVPFSKPMNKATVQSAFSLKAAGAPVSGTFTWDSNTLVFTPASPLPAATTCTISITTTAVDLSGNSPASPFSSSFVTYTPDLAAWRKDLEFFDEGSATQFSQRTGHALVVFDNKLWVIGGTDGINDLNDVWRSSDGVTWTRATANAAFSARHGHACAVWNNAIWLTGGVNQVIVDGFPEDNYLDDVWRSTDGVTWTRMSASAEYYTRSEHVMLVFNNQLWMVGGITTDTDGNEILLGDAWSSSNGTNWTERSLVVGFTPRRSPAAWSALSKLWVVGGFGVDSVTQQQRPLNDIWSSSNGDTWQRVIAAAPFAGRSGAGFAFFKNRFTLVGGSGADAGDWDIFYNDVWTSADGINWNRNRPDGVAVDHFSRRTAHTLGILGTRLYLVAGETDLGPFNDVWSTP